MKKYLFLIIILITACSNTTEPIDIDKEIKEQFTGTWTVDMSQVRDSLGNSGVWDNIIYLIIDFPHTDSAYIQHIDGSQFGVKGIWHAYCDNDTLRLHSDTTYQNGFYLHYKLDAVMKSNTWVGYFEFEYENTNYCRYYGSINGKKYY